MRSGWLWASLSLSLVGLLFSHGCTEEELLASLRRLMHGRTTFIIAHRLSAVRHANTILVLDKGRIIERGRHA